MAKLKIKVVGKDIKYDEIVEMNRSHSVNALVIKGTDALIYLEDRDPFLYSKKAYLRGSEARSSKFCSFMHRNEYHNHYGLFNLSDFYHAMRALEHESFSKNEHLATKKMLLEDYKDWRDTKGTQRYPEYGVELEIESDEAMPTAIRQEIKDMGGKLIHDVGCDGSVRGGTEIRFNHPALSGWKYKEIENILAFCKDKGATTKYGTAGMHIHISRPDVKKVVDNFRKNLTTMQAILYPINCRKLKTYDGKDMYFGVNDNIFRDQTGEFGTLEIRAWNSTLDPKLFMARIKFCKTFTNWLAKTKEVSVSSFFDFMSKQEKANYSYMLNHAENPHMWGFPPKAVNALLA